MMLEIILALIEYDCLKSLIKMAMKQYIKNHKKE